MGRGSESIGRVAEDACRAEHRSLLDVCLSRPPAVDHSVFGNALRRISVGNATLERKPPVGRWQSYIE